MEILKNMVFEVRYRDNSNGTKSAEINYKNNNK